MASWQAKWAFGAVGIVAAVGVYTTVPLAGWTIGTIAAAVWGIGIMQMASGQ